MVMLCCSKLVFLQTHLCAIRDTTGARRDKTGDTTHAYVGCRTALTRALLGMQDSVSMDVLFYSRDPDRGWQFKPEAPGCTPDTVNGGMRFIRELYEKENSAEKTVSPAQA